MTRQAGIQSRKYAAFGREDIDRIPQLQSLPAEERIAMKAVSAVLPFRVSNYVVEELIDWDNIPRDPIFQLTFPQRGMLDAEDCQVMAGLVERRAPKEEVQAVARRIQLSLNPHPSGQMDLNVPRLEGETLQGFQHKYEETLLFFPSQGQTCHSYCTYCFRWAQFVGIDELKFANREAGRLVDYLVRHSEVESVLITGGDPLIMKTKVLRRYVEPLLEPGLEHIESIRLGTKALSFWPHRFLGDADADDLLRLFEEVVASGKHLAFMAHVSHPRELESPAAQEAVRRILATGAVIRSQAPVIRHINDDPEVWAEMWRSQVRMGIVPYYQFVERDTGPRNYFEVPLARCLEIYRKAYRQMSGLARTARGPVMSATPGKVMVDGITEIEGRRVFALHFVQARDPAWVNQPFFARFDPSACWLDDLRPLRDSRFFFQKEARIRVNAKLPAVADARHRA